MTQPRLVKPSHRVPAHRGDAVPDAPVIKFGGLHLAHDGLQVLGTPDFDDYEKAMRFVVYSSEKSDFWKADLLAYGRSREDWAGLIDAVIDAGTFSKSTVDNYVSAAKRLPASDRVDGLSFEYHRQVVSLPSPERVELLHRAKDEHWPVSKLRAEVRKRRTTRKLLSGQASELARAYDRLVEHAMEASHLCREIPRHDAKDADKVLGKVRRELDRVDAALATYRKAQGR